MKDLISNERFANALLFVHDKYGYLNRSVIYLERPLGNINYDWYLLKFHGIQKFCSDNQLNYQHGLAIDKDYIIEQCTEIYNKYGKLSKKYVWVMVYMLLLLTDCLVDLQIYIKN